MEVQSYYINEPSSTSIIAPFCRLNQSCSLEEAYEMKLMEREIDYANEKSVEYDLKSISTDFYTTNKTIKELNAELATIQKGIDEHDKTINEYLLKQKELLCYFQESRLSKDCNPFLSSDDNSTIIKMCKDLEETIHSATLNWRYSETERLEQTKANVSIQLSKYEKIMDLLKIIQSEFGGTDAVTNIVSNCPICLENKPEQCSVPCGHVFCSECYTKLNKKCAMCNKPVSQFVKLYM